MSDNDQEMDEIEERIREGFALGGKRSWVILQKKDIAPEHLSVSWDELNYEHFTPAAKKAIVKKSEAVYVSNGLEKVIHPPSQAYIDQFESQESP